MIGLTLLAAGCAIERSSDNRDWAWQGDMEEGDWLNIRNTNGTVKVLGAPDGQVAVTAVQRATGRRVNYAHFLVNSHGNTVTICAVYSRSDACDWRNSASTSTTAGPRIGPSTPRHIRAST